MVLVVVQILKGVVQREPGIRAISARASRRLQDLLGSSESVVGKSVVDDDN